jgi:deoxyribodipyrimidine photo-lyase
VLHGYAGIALAIVDKHDRPWSNRPVFGLVRTMTGASTAKKFDAAQYIRQRMAAKRPSRWSDPGRPHLVNRLSVICPVSGL